jgi:hypothetical protein
MDKKLAGIRPLLTQNQILLNSIEHNTKEGAPDSSERNVELLTALDQSFTEVIDRYKDLAESLQKEDKILVAQDRRHAGDKRGTERKRMGREG